MGAEERLTTTIKRCPFFGAPIVASGGIPRVPPRIDTRHPDLLCFFVFGDTAKLPTKEDTEHEDGSSFRFPVGACLSACVWVRGEHAGA